MRHAMLSLLVLLGAMGCTTQNATPPADSPKKAGAPPKFHEPAREVVQAWAKAGGGYCALRIDKVGVGVHDPRDHPGDKKPAVHVAANELPSFVFHDAPSRSLADLPAMEVPFALLLRKFPDSRLPELASLTQLESLTLLDPTLADAGMKRIGTLKQLNSLSLDSDGITDGGLQELAGLKDLECLLTHCQKVTDAGVKALTGLRRLRQLVLIETRIADAGTKQLADQ